jgi:hypothetical protein
MWGTSVKNFKKLITRLFRKQPEKHPSNKKGKKREKKADINNKFKVHEGLDQRPNLDTDVAHTGVGELGWEALQTLRDLALLGCGEWGVGDLRSVGLENEGSNNS